MRNNNPLVALATLTAMMGANSDYIYKDYYSGNHIKHTKQSKDGRKVEYYTDEKGNIRRRKR